MGRNAENSTDTSFQSQTFNLPLDNIDTDQIYPARFLTTTAPEGLGRFCFQDWRENPQSQQYQYFKDLDTERQQILVAGDNFGCGSSREHAAWSLLDAGFRAVVSTRFGDIFRSNALNNGLLLITVEPETLDFLLQHAQHPLKIDIQARQIDSPGWGRKEFPLDSFSWYCLVHGINALDYLLEHRDEIARFEAG